MGGRVLEPACGTGRVLIPLLAAGLDAEGQDHCPDMLAICREHCRARGFDPALYQADMSAFVKPDRYEAIVLPRGAIRNIDGREATLQTLESFHKSLAPGGLLLIDVRVPLLGPQAESMEHWRRDPYMWTRETVIFDYDPVANRTTYYTRYQKWRDGDLLTTELHRFCLQNWNVREFRDLLTEAGFTDISLTADFREDNPPDGQSKYWNFRARRP